MYVQDIRMRCSGTTPTGSSGKVPRDPGGLAYRKKEMEGGVRLRSLSREEGRGRCRTYGSGQRGREGCTSVVSVTPTVGSPEASAGTCTLFRNVRREYSLHHID